MAQRPAGKLRRGWTTGACATAATRSALTALVNGEFADPVRITLPKGETPEFSLAHQLFGTDWAEAGVIKDAGDDPDVTHGAMVVARVTKGALGGGVRFFAGEGVGTVTRPGLPVAVGEAAINPVPRQMMLAQVAEIMGENADVDIRISIPGGAEIALKTWNPRLGILGGLSILGTTGVVRPFSCAAWIASIHRGIDVARAANLKHVAGCTGATSETAVQRHFKLPDHAMLDMGDFAGGMLKYLHRHPVDRVTIGGGLGKLAKLAQGHGDLHSGRSQTDFGLLADWTGNPSIAQANSVLEAHQIGGNALVDAILQRAQVHGTRLLNNPDVRLDVVAVDRQGHFLGSSG